MADAVRSTPTDESLVRVGKIIERARTGRGLSARKLAVAVGKSASYLRAIEQGANPKTKRPSRLSADTILAVSRELGVAADELLELSGYDTHPDALGAPDPGVPTQRVADDHLKRIQDATRGLARRSPFLYERALERLEKFAADFQLIAGGTMRCSPEEEKYLTRLAISQCQRQLLAVSYGDEQRWPSTKHGEVYLRLHEPLRERNVAVTRIFLLAPKEVPGLKSIFKRHVELGITTYILDPNLVDESYWRDMVIYDDNLLRTATAFGSDPDRKSAEFTDDPGRIAKAVSDFRDLLTIARVSLASADVVLSHLPNTSQD